MSRAAKSRSRVIVIGVSGVFLLVAMSFAAALWNSSEPYRPEQIDRVVIEQQANAEVGR